jgi:hypothetical protein
MLRRAKFLVALLAAIVAGVAGASAVMGSTDPAPGTDAAALQPDGTGAAIATTAPDPDVPRGGAAPPRWAVRVYRSRTGAACPDANRTVGGDFGRVDGDGSFHPLALGATGDCAELSADHPYELVVRHFPADDQRGARAVVFGVVSSAVSAVALTVDGAERDVPIANGAYLAALADEDAAATSVTFTLANGTQQVQALRSDARVVQAP